MDTCSRRMGFEEFMAKIVEYCNGTRISLATETSLSGFHKELYWLPALGNSTFVVEESFPVPNAEDVKVSNKIPFHDLMAAAKFYYEG